MKNRKSNLSGIKGLKQLDPKLIEDFKNEMNETVIPEIIRGEEESEILAAESRLRDLKLYIEEKRKNK